MERVDCGVKPDNKQLSYDRSADELRECSMPDFSFEIQSAEGKPGMSVAILEIRVNGKLVRRNESKPFPTGALKEKTKKRSLNKVNLNVVLENPTNLPLSDYEF